MVVQPTTIGSVKQGESICKLHTTLRVTPAIAAGVTTPFFDVIDLVNLLIASETEKGA